MSNFQLVALGVFAGLVAVAYRKELFSLVSRISGRSGSKTVAAPSIAIAIVNDLISVTELRDKLAAENCPEGVEACTALLRVIVEHTQNTASTNRKPVV